MQYVMKHGATFPDANLAFSSHSALSDADSHNDISLISQESGMQAFPYLYVPIDSALPETTSEGVRLPLSLLK